MSTQVITFCSSIMNQKKSDIFIAHFEQLTSLSLHLGAHHRVRHWEQSKVRDRGATKKQHLNALPLKKTLEGMEKPMAVEDPYEIS